MTMIDGEQQLLAFSERIFSPLMRSDLIIALPRMCVCAWIYFHVLRITVNKNE
jgi:hypothetical protein